MEEKNSPNGMLPTKTLHFLFGWKINWIDIIISCHLKHHLE